MSNADSQKTLFQDALVALPDGNIERRSILLEDSIISRVSENSIPAGSANAQSVEGLTLLPGFIDIHIHGAVGVDTINATEDDLYRVSQYLAGQGVTTWVPTLVPASDEDNKRAVSAIDRLITDQESRPPASRAIGVHYEGPFVNSDQCGALRTQFFRTYAGKHDLESLPIPSSKGAVRIMTMAPEIEGGYELIQELCQRGWVVSVGHTKADYQVLERAREAGAKHITHFMNAMPSLHHRAPGPVGWGLMNDDVTLDLIADGIHADPKVLGLVIRSKTAERVVLISDAVAPAGLGDGAYRLWGETITVERGRTRNERGSIAGSVISLTDAFQRGRSIGLSIPDLVKLTSANAARLLRIDNNCGSIAEGKQADLVGIDDSGNVRLTIVGGRVAFDSRDSQ